MRHTSVLAAVLSAALLQACATAPPPDALDQGNLDETEQAIATAAANDDVARYSPVELQKAQDRYNAANQAWVNGDKDRARHLAYLARRHAEIAQALAENGAAESEAKRINTQRDSLRLKAREQELSSQQKEIEQLRQQLAELKPRVSDEGITLTIGNVLFDFDSAVLSAAASEPLDRLAAFLRQHPDRNVRVEGYTDSVGDAAYNQQLSQRRALSVADAMAQRGISHDRMSVTGYGEKNPVASNDTEAGRRQNRRVEFVILN